MKSQIFAALLLAAITVTGGLPALAQEKKPAPKSKLSARYLDNEVIRVETDPESNKKYFVMRMDFELSGPGNRWVALDAEFRLSLAVPLVDARGRLLSKRWNNLFTPQSPAPARWTNCLVDVDFDYLEKAANLPKGKTFTVWAMALIRDYDSRSYLGSSWKTAAPLIVTTSKIGKVTDIQTPRLIQHKSHTEFSTGKLLAAKSQCKASHLIAKENVSFFKVANRANVHTPVAQIAGKQIWGYENFGQCFEKIDTEEKARELARLKFTGGTIIKTNKQYDAIYKALRKMGWTVNEDIFDVPESFGEKVEAVEGFGYKVSLLVAEPQSGEGFKLGDIAIHEIYVAHDGRMSDKRRVCITGVKAQRTNSSVPVDAIRYSNTLRKIFTNEGSEDIEDKFAVAKERFDISAPTAINLKNYNPKVAPLPTEAAPKPIAAKTPTARPDLTAKEPAPTPKPHQPTTQPTTRPGDSSGNPPGFKFPK